MIAALSRATSTATGSMSVAMQRASRPQRQRGEGEQAGAGADVGDIGEARAVALQPVERFEAAGGGRMLAGAEGEAGVDLEIDRARRSRRDGSACGRRSGRRGSAPAPPGSSSPSRPRRAPRPRGSPRPSAAQRGESSSLGLALEISVDQPLVGRGPGRARRRPAPAGRRGRRRVVVRSPIASPCARVQATVTRKLILRLAAASLASRSSSRLVSAAA